MAVIKTIEKGESLTFGFVLPETYNLANLQSVKVYIGSTVYTHTMVSRTARVELSSNETALLTGRNVIHFVIDDAVFGIKKLNCGMLEVLPTQATHKDTSINTGYDVEIVLTIDVETVSVESVLYNVLQGDAATISVGTVTTLAAGEDATVENAGDEHEAVFNFGIPQGAKGDKGDAGDFFVGQFNTVIDKLNIVWVDGWVHINTGSATNMQKIDVGYMAINTGQGTVQLKPIVHYPASLTYLISSKPTGFYVKDVDNLLNENTDFESFEIRYNISTDTVNKFDGTAFKYGHNVIHDELGGDTYHSASGVKAFKAVYPEFTGENIQAILDPLTNYTGVDYFYTPTYCKIKEANILSRPVSQGAITESIGSNADILAIASHYDNTFALHNITANATTFLKKVIAIGSCQATGIPVTGTSYGYGMEFSEVGNNLGLNAAYPDVTFDHVIGYGTGAGNTFTDSVGTRNYSNILELSVGTKIKLGLTLETSAEYTIATLGSTTFTTVETLTLEAGVNYVWITAHIGTVWQPVANNQTYYQSPVTSIIMAKFRKIQDLSGANWHICRLAARATASNGGVWDMYRGFGIINVDAAVQYIEDNYKSLEYRAMLADQHDGLNGISPFITYEDLLPNSPISKALAEGQFVAKETGKSLIADTEITRLAGVTNQTLAGLGGESVSNKQNSLTTDGTGIKYPTVDAVNDGLILKADSIDLVEAKQSISTLESVLSDANINQEAQVTASGVDTVSLPKTAANTGMQVQLFGESNETSNVLGTGRVRSVGNNLIKPTYIIGFQVSTADGTFVNNATFSRSDYFRVAASTAYILSSNTNTGTDHRIAFYDLNKVFISGASQTSGQPISVTSPANAYYAIVSSLTTKVDTFRLTRGTSSFETYRQSILQLTAPELRSNGLIKDEIRKGANGYELVKRVGVGTLGANGIAGGDFEGGLIGTKSDGVGSVSTWELNTSNPISGTQDGRLIVTTEPSSTGRPSIQFKATRAAGQYRRLSFDYKVNSGSPRVSAITEGLGDTININKSLSGSGKLEFYYNCNGTQALCIYFGKSGLYDLQLDNIKDELINTPDGGATGNIATVIGSNIHYTLATPTITQIAHAGLLNSNSNGTAYFEPIIADAGVYSSNLTIQLTDYPISSFESIRKYANGTYTELNPATAVIASGGLSFTHPDLVSGDLVMFTYAYSKESIGRNMTLTHYDSRFVIADTANSKVYRWKIRSTNGVATIALTEV